jgi:group I intron endonuclease
MIGIYKITSPTKRVYIGQSLDIKKRISKYKYNDCKKQPRLYNSLKKYGFESHTFEVIEECSIDLLNDRERYYQEFYNVLEIGLNCNLVKTEFKKMKHSQESILKIKEASRNRVFSEESKDKIRQKALNRKATTETKLKLSKSAKKTKNGKKIVLDINTGIFYESVFELCCIIKKYKLTYLRKLIRDKKTQYIYA